MMMLELFGCAGGMADGFRRAGITFDFSFDRDEDACASYATNLGHAPIQMDLRDLVRMARAGWSPGRIDLLVADPPCTPWSRAGKRKGLADERDLLQETCELIALLRPRAYLIANVPGLDDVRLRNRGSSDGRGAQALVRGPDAILLSECAAAILQGFPESWVFCGKTKTSRWAQIGMAMPPPLAHAVATSIARWLRKVGT